MKAIFLAAQLLLLTALASGAQEVLTGPVVNPANGHSYYLLNKTTWTASESAAVALGGHLATVRNAAENEWILQTFSRFGGEDRALWIGLTDQAVEGTFVWASGEPVKFQNWAQGEPNNSAGGGYEEDWGYMAEHNSGAPTLLPGLWNDAPNDGGGGHHPMFGVVEVTGQAAKPAAVPPPAPVSGVEVVPVTAQPRTAELPGTRLLIIVEAVLLLLTMGGLLLLLLIWLRHRNAARQKSRREQG